MPLWWPRTHTGSTGSGHDSASEPQGECCWSKSPWRCSCLCWGDGEQRTWTCYHFWQVVSEVIKAGLCLQCQWWTVPGPEGIRRHHLQSVSRTIQIHHEQADWRDTWAGLITAKQLRHQIKSGENISYTRSNGNNGLSVSTLGLDWNALITLKSHDIHGTLTLTVSAISKPKVSLISPAMRWKSTRPCIHGSLRMSCNHFADPLTAIIWSFHLLLAFSSLLWFHFYLGVGENDIGWVETP